MKTLILYASKYGATQQIAERIKELIDNSIIYDLSKTKDVDLKEYDCVVIGSSVYAGQAHKAVKEFMSKNLDKLKDKNLGLFICSLDKDNIDTYLKDNYPLEIIEKAIIKSHLGGIFDPKKAKSFERMIIKLVSKKADYVNTIEDKEIIEFAKHLKQ